jgi:sugar lactone lactonase YvrE
VQFLVSYSSEEDLGGGPSRFASFVIGKKPVQKPIAKPYGLALRDGALYVCDAGASSIDILDLRARQMRYFTPSGDGELVTPVNIAVDFDGTRYIADSARGQVLVFGPDDAYRGALGEKAQQKGRAHGAGPAESDTAEAAGTAGGMRPTDVLIQGDRLYVADLRNHCARVYDKTTWKEVFTIPRDPAGADSVSRLYAPTNLAMDEQGRLYASDLGAFRVQQYDTDGRFLRSFGAGAGDRPGEFARPKGIAVDREGRLYVVDAASQVVQVFDAEGRLLMYFGEQQGDAPGLDLPAKVAIDYDHLDFFRQYADPSFEVEHLILVSSQYGDRKLNVFGFGHRR